MKSKHHDFGIVFFIHFFLIALFWLLPFLFNWKLVLLSVFLFYLNHYIWKITYGLCPLTMVQFKTKNPKINVCHYYLTRYLHLKIDLRKMNFIQRSIIPPIIFIISIIWQVLLGFKPLIF